LATLLLLSTLRLLSALLLFAAILLLAALRFLVLFLLLLLILVLLWSRPRVAKSSGPQQQDGKKCGADNSGSLHGVPFRYSLNLEPNINCIFWNGLETS